MIFTGLLTIITVCCQKKSSNKDENYKTLIEGIWAESEDENALFYIKNDSVYYLENLDKPLNDCAVSLKYWFYSHVYTIIRDVQFL